jgi:hypothetical protein
MMLSTVRMANEDPAFSPRSGGLLRSIAAAAATATRVEQMCMKPRKRADIIQSP